MVDLSRSEMHESILVFNLQLSGMMLCYKGASKQWSDKVDVA